MLKSPSVRTYNAKVDEDAFVLCLAQFSLSISPQKSAQVLRDQLGLWYSFKAQGFLMQGKTPRDVLTHTNAFSHSVSLLGHMQVTVDVK